MSIIISDELEDTDTWMVRVDGSVRQLFKDQKYQNHYRSERRVIQFV
ncbi:hypothetical protein MEN41_22675 [Dolichospermum sp. ST_con]|nr:hypothetical protein [Dolichospermum sp. ST_con]